MNNVKQPKETETLNIITEFSDFDYIISTFLTNFDPDIHTVEEYKEFILTYILFISGLDRINASKEAKILYSLKDKATLNMVENYISSRNITNQYVTTKDKINMVLTLKTLNSRFEVIYNVS